MEISDLVYSGGVFGGLSYTGSMHDSGSCGLGSIPSSPTL